MIFRTTTRISNTIERIQNCMKSSDMGQKQQMISKVIYLFFKPKPNILFLLFKNSPHIQELALKYCLQC